MKKMIAAILVVLMVWGLVGCASGGSGSEASSSSWATEDLVNVPSDLWPSWGDSQGRRNAYTCEDVEKGVLGDKVTLNSIIDSPIRDARRFICLSEADSETRDFTRNVMRVEDGKTYDVWIYVQNDNPETTSEGTRAAISLPVKSEEHACLVSGFVYSDNAAAVKAWSTATLVADQDFALNYVYGGAKIFNEAYPEGTELPDEIVTKAASENGVAIGYDKMDGMLPGGSDYGAYIKVQVEIKYLEVAPMTVRSRVRLSGTTDWQTAVEGVSLGDELDVITEYKNVGNDTQCDVIGNFVLDGRLEYVPGSVSLCNASYADGIGIDDDFLERGVNIGNYMAEANALVSFRVRVAGEITAENPAEVQASFSCRDSVEQTSVSIG